MPHLLSNQPSLTCGLYVFIHLMMAMVVLRERYQIWCWLKRMAVISAISVCPNRLITKSLTIIGYWSKPYQIVYNISEEEIESHLEEMNGQFYICIARNGKQLSERITPLDKKRLDDSELSLADLVRKYFAYLLGK